MKELVKKLTEVMAAVKHIPKRGRNEFHKYDYATESDIADAIRDQLASRHVLLIPAITGESRRPVGDKGSVLTVLKMEMEFYDGESGQSIKKPWRGYGTDKDDKGGYKAMTGGEKYFLLKTFLIPTGDDPEADDKPEQKRQTRQAPTKPATEKVAAKDAKITEDQRHELEALRIKAEWSPEITGAMIKRHGFNSSKEITASKFEAIKKELELGALEIAPF